MVSVCVDCSLLQNGLSLMHLAGAWFALWAGRERIRHLRNGVFPGN